MPEGAYRCIAAAEALALMRLADEQNRAYRLFDARDADSYARGHLAGAEPLAERDLGHWIDRLPRAEALLIYCYHGHASQELARIFADFGHTEVYSIDGGFEALAQVMGPASGARPAGGDTAPVPSAPLREFMVREGFTTPDIDAAADNGMTRLMKAARAARLDLVDELIGLGADLEARNSDGNTALWLACFGGDAAVVQRLIAAGARLDNQNDNGATALMYCASSGRDALVGLLLEAGADAGLRTLDDFRAVDLAATAGSLRLLRHTA
jgi:rhodanese-related sulfurtransferase